jgi:Mg-chelatase subunit ChlD
MVIGPFLPFTMDFLSQFINVPNATATASRKGGILLKGKSRAERQPVHMMMLVDTSGSMDSDHKLDSVKRSLQVMLLLLSEQDRLSLVKFDDSSSIILNKVVPNSQEREAISYQIAGLRTDGSTNMSAGLLDSRDLVEASGGRKQGLILLTDGHANMGVCDQAGLLRIVSLMLEEKPGLSITTVGYGVDHNNELLTEIARVGGGGYNVVKDLNDVASTFGDVLGGLSSVSAQRVVIEFPPGYLVKSAYSTTVGEDGFSRVKIGDLYAETEISVLFEGSPSLGPIRVTGTDMSTLNSFEHIVAPTLCSTDSEFDVNFIMSDFRTRVAELLNLCRNSRNEMTFRERIRSLLAEIRETSRIATHPLTAFLLEDLERALEIQESNRGMTQHEVTEMAQHSAYISMTRGLRTRTTQMPPPPFHAGLGLRRQRAVGIQEPGSPPAAPRAGMSPTSPTPSVFSNPAEYDENEREAQFLSPTANAQQRQMASLMRSLSNDHPN